MKLILTIVVYLTRQIEEICLFICQKNEDYVDISKVAPKNKKRMIE